MTLENLLDTLETKQQIKISDFWHNWEWSGESYYAYQLSGLLNKEVNNVFIHSEDTLYIIRGLRKLGRYNLPNLNML